MNKVTDKKSMADELKEEIAKKECRDQKRRIERNSAINARRKRRKS